MMWRALFLAVLGTCFASAQEDVPLPPARPTTFSATSLIVTVEGTLPLPPNRPTWTHGPAGEQDLRLPKPRPVSDTPPPIAIALPEARQDQIPAREPLPEIQVSPELQTSIASAAAPLSCRAQLDALNVIYIRTPDRSEPNGCGLTNAVEVSNFNGVRLRPPGFMTCEVALATALWLKDSVVPEARQRLGKTLSAIDQYSTYSCRSRPSGRLSEHAFGNAIDVARFHFTDGSLISIDPDWNKRGRVGRYLRSITQASCNYYSVVLSPESDAAHYNHLHLDTGDWVSCDG